MAIDSSTIAAGLDAARANIAGAIKKAASTTGASFEYLVSAAKIESNLDPKAQASTSSARGLYQFIEQTWLGTVKEAGASFGFGKYADAITKSSSGTYTVSDASTRDEILKLRDDPAVNAAMAGVLTQSNSFKLTGAIGRRPTDGELYIAHFMGVNGAARLINAAQDSPNAVGAGMFPGPASANRSIFYNRDGSARSVSQVYSELTSRYESAAKSATARAAIASAGGSAGQTQAVAEFVPPPMENAVYLSQFPQVKSGQAQQVDLAQMSEPVFRSLYQGGDRTDPVSHAVRELWGNRASLTSNESSGDKSKNGPGGIGLFSDPTGMFSG